MTIYINDKLVEYFNDDSILEQRFKAIISSIEQSLSVEGQEVRYDKSIWHTQILSSSTIAQYLKPHRDLCKSFKELLQKCSGLELPVLQEQNNSIYR